MMGFKGRFGAVEQVCSALVLLSSLSFMTGCASKGSEADGGKKEQPLDYSAADWTHAGPSPIEDPRFVSLPFAFGTRATGAVDKIVLDPNNPTGLYAASANGGVWKNLDYTVSLTPPSLTQWETNMDHLPSLAMGGLAVDPTNSQHLVAGTGCHSSSHWMCSLQVEGLIYESNNGANGWSLIGNVANQQVQAVAVRGTNILVATGAPFGFGSIYRRSAAGGTFDNVQSTGGLPAGDLGPVTDLVADPLNANRYFAVLGNRGGHGGVYVSSDSGQNWTRVSRATVTDALNASSDNARLAIAPTGRLVVVVATRGQITRIEYTDDQGATWGSMDVPGHPVAANMSAALVAITDVTRTAGAANIVVTTGTVAHGLAAGANVRLTNVPLLAGENLNGDWQAQVISATQFGLTNPTTGNPGTGNTTGATVAGGYSYGWQTLSVASVTRAAGAPNLVVTTTANHGYVEATNVTLAGVPALGGDDLNRHWRISPISATQFALLDRFTGNPGTGSTSAAAVTVNGGTAFGWDSPNAISFARHLLAVTIDPNDHDVVYVSGDASPIKIARGRISGPTGGLPSRQWSSLNIWQPGAATVNGSLAHDDTRDLLVDSTGRLLIATDGGVYLNAHPEDASGDWYSVAGDMGTTEMYAIDMEPLSGALIAGLQDNGTPSSDAGTGGPTGETWYHLTYADGQGVASVNSGRMSGGATPYAFRYTTCQVDSCFTRFLRDAAGNPMPDDLDGNGSPDDNTPIPLVYDPARTVVTNPTAVPPTTRPFSIYDVVDTGWMLTLVTNPHDPDRLLIGARAARPNGTPVAITSVVRTAGAADIVVTTTAAHGLATGNNVRLAGVPDLAAGDGVNGDWGVVVNSATEFELINLLTGNPGTGSTVAASVGAGTAVGLVLDKNGNALLGGLWESRDRGETIDPIPVNGPEAPVGATGVDAGAPAAAEALWVAAPSGLYFRTAAGGALTKSNFPAGQTPVAVVMNPASPATVYVTTAQDQVFRSADGTLAAAVWENITGDLDEVARYFAGQLVTGKPGSYRDIAYVPSAASDRVIIAAASGTHGAYMMSLDQPRVWMRIGYASLPSPIIPYVPVTTLDYEASVDQLVVGTAGRGAWTVDGVSQLNRAPIAQCKDITVPANASCEAYVSGPDFNDGSADSDATDPVFFGIYVGPGLTNTSHGPYPLGPSTVRIKVSDNEGASSLCEPKTLTVEDQTPPTLEIPADVEVSSCSELAIVNVGTPTATDNCSANLVVTGHIVSKNGAAVVPPIPVTPPTINLGPGNYEIEWVATDGSTTPVTDTQYVSVGTSIQAGQTYLVGQGGQVQDASGNPAAVFNSGTGATTIRGIQNVGGVSTPARVGSIHAGGSVEVNQGGQVIGNIYAVGNTSQVNMSGVTGAIVPVSSTGLPAMPTLPAIPAATNTDFWVNPNETKTIPKGNYRDVGVNGNPTQPAILTFEAGDYYITNLYLNSAGITVVADPGTRIFVRQNFNFHNPFRIAANSNDLAPIFLGLAGTGGVGMYAPFSGTIVAPGRNLSFGTGNGLTFQGSFFANGIEVTPGSVLVCDAAVVPEYCTDGVMNFDETDLDCGGAVCQACGDGASCDVDSDCSSAVCESNTCETVACDDGLENGSETDVDCGGGACGACDDGASCIVGSDCLSGSCPAGICEAVLPACSTGTYQSENMFHSTGNAWWQGGWNIYSNGYISTMHNFAARPAVLTVRALGQAANGLPHMTVSVGGTLAVPTAGVFVNSGGFNNYTFTFTPTSGSKEVRITYDNDYNGPQGDRNLIIDQVAITCP